MSSNLHRNSTEANKHTPKGFDLADNNTTLLRDERGQSRYIDNLVNERVENLVDGNSAPPTTTSGHLYVLIDEGSGTVNTDWQGANYDDIVRIQDGVWVAITPVNGYLIFNKTDEKYYKFGSTGWQKLINLVEDTTPQLGGDLDLNGNDINGTGNVDVTGNVIADIVQLRGGTGTQGEMSWNTDEETVQLVMDGTTLHIGQDTLVVVRNNTASIITKGTAVYATGTLGASGRITVAPMIADGTIPARLFIGLTAEDIAIGADGQVMTFGKIRQINTSAFNDGDVLWLSPTVAGQLTATEPTAPNLKIATAFVIHDATNGTLMVRAEQGNDLHLDQRVQVSGLTNNDVLTWNNVNQRWQNAQPVLPNWGSIGGTLSAQTDLQTALNLKLNITDAYGGKRYTLIKPNGTKEFYDTLTQVRSNWSDGDVLHQFADETISWALSASDSMFILPSINWNGNGFKITMQDFTSSTTVGFLISSKTINIFDLNFDANINANNTYLIRCNGTGVLNLSNVKGVQTNLTGFGTATYMLQTQNTAVINGDKGTIFSSLSPIVIAGANTTCNAYIGTSTSFVNGITFNNFRLAESLRGRDLNINVARLFKSCIIQNSKFNQSSSVTGINIALEGGSSENFIFDNCEITYNSADTFSTGTIGTIDYNMCKIKNTIARTGTFTNLINSQMDWIGSASSNSSNVSIINSYINSSGAREQIRMNGGSLIIRNSVSIHNDATTSNSNILWLPGVTIDIQDSCLINLNNGGNVRGSGLNSGWSNTYFNKGENAFLGADGYTNQQLRNANKYRLTHNQDFCGNSGIGLVSPYPAMTTAERDALTNVRKGYTIENTTTNFLQVYNGSTWKDLLDLT